MKKTIIPFTLSMLCSIGANAEAPVTDAEQLNCSKRVTSYIKGLETAYDQTKSVEAKHALDDAKMAQQNNMNNACVAEDKIPALANSKRAIKAATDAVRTGSN